MDLYRVYIEDTRVITKQVTVDVEGVISTELVSVEVPDPITVGYYVVESEETLRNDIFKNMPDFKYEKLNVAYGDVSQLHSAVSDLSAQQMVDSLKSKLDETTFRNVLNFVFGKPLIELPKPVIEEPSSDSLNESGSESPIGIGIIPETPDITNALKEYFEKEVPSLESLIAQKQKELAEQKSLTLAEESSVVVEPIQTPVEGSVPTGFTSFVDVIPPTESFPLPQPEESITVSDDMMTIPSLPSDMIQQLEQEVAQKQQIADQLFQDQVALINFRNALLPLLHTELQQFIQRDLELTAQTLMKEESSLSFQILPSPPPTADAEGNVLIEETIVVPEEVVSSADTMTEVVATKQKVLADGTVITEIATPTKIFTTSTNVGAPSPSSSLMQGLDTTSTAIFSPQQPMPQNEDVAKMFLGATNAPIAFEATPPETLRKIQVVLPPSEKIPEEEILNKSESILPNFGGSVMASG